MRTVRFPVYMGPQLMGMNIEELDLSERSKHCLQRAGFKHVGDLIENVTGAEELLRIRNLGVKSADEIMLHLFLLQYRILPLERREIFLRRVAELNQT